MKMEINCLVIYSFWSCGPVGASLEEGHENGQRAGVTLLWRQDERVGRRTSFRDTLKQSRAYKKAGNLFPRVCSDRTRAMALNWKRVHLDELLGRNSWGWWGTGRFLGGVVDASSLEVFKARLDGIWASWSSERHPSPWSGVWNRMVFMVPFNPNNFKILWFPLMPVCVQFSNSGWKSCICVDLFLIHVCRSNRNCSFHLNKRKNHVIFLCMGTIMLTFSKLVKNSEFKYIQL